MEEQKSEVRSQKSEGSNGGSEQLTVIDEPSVADAQSTAVLYNADAKQRIPFRLDNEGETVEVAFILNAQTDDAIAEYDRLKSERYFAADEEETGEAAAMESSDESFRAAVWLLKDRLLDAEGFGADGEEKPENWKDLVFEDDRDRAAVIDEAYLAAQVVPAPLAPKGKLIPWTRPTARRSIINLLAAFNGFQLRLTHERTGRPTADQITEFKSIKKSRYVVQGTKLGQQEIMIPPKARRFGALYDALGFTATGYAGRVPLHHKTLVVIHDLDKQAEAVRKNLTS